MNDQFIPPEPSPSKSEPPVRAVVRRTSSIVSATGRPSAQSAASANELTPAFVWRVFCNWWKWVVPVGVLMSVAAGMIVLFTHVPEYEASALIKIESSPTFIAYSDGNLNKGSDRYVETQIEILRGPVVLEPLLADPEIAAIEAINKDPEPVKYMQNHLTVKQVGKSDLYSVSFVSPSARDAKTVANKIVQLYIQKKESKDNDRSQQIIDLLEVERDRREKDVMQKRKVVIDAAKTLTGKDPFGQGVIVDEKTAFSPAASLFHNMTETEVEAAVLNAEITALKMEIDSEKTREKVEPNDDDEAMNAMLDIEISNRFDVRQLETRIAAIDQQIAMVKSKPRPRIGDTFEADPDYIRLASLMEESKAELLTLKEQVRKSILQMKKEKSILDRQRLVAVKERELAALNGKHRMLQQKYEDSVKERTAGSAQSAGLEMAKAELAREERVFELIAARKLALQTEKSAPPREAPLNPATLPTTAIEPIPYKLTFLACLVSLVAPLSMATVYETVVRRISSTQQLAAHSHLPVLGEIARFPVRRVVEKQRSVQPLKQRDLLVYAESIDSLRTSLMLTDNLGAPGKEKIIAFCSAASGEGKTSVATSLAMSIAEASKQPTLIMDADLRAPDAAKYLNVADEPGLSEVLCGKASLSQALHRVGTTNAYVMPAGKHAVNPHHILDGKRIDSLLKSLRGKFCTIIIDTPPILSASESLVYANAADLVVLCSLTDVSRSKQVCVAAERLQMTGANLVGAVLSGVPSHQYAYRYGVYGNQT